NSMMWYDLDVDEVKKLIKQNKEGKQAQPLEELKSQTLPKEVQSVDLIQEDSIDRFEKKDKSKRKNKRRNSNNEGGKSQSNN
ncbi:hypothetical protein HA378_33445, partial [Escherichia coli]|nr:hypothetical protein [Escherichia coli]